MKKIIAIILALCLMCGAAAFASVITPESRSGSTTVTATIDETYTMTIPAALNIAYGATSTDLDLTVSAYRLKAENQLKLSQSWDGTLNSGSNSISYALRYNGSDVSSDSNPVTFTADGTETLQVVIDETAWNTAAAGEYTDTVTFNAAIIAK